MSVGTNLLADVAAPKQAKTPDDWKPVTLGDAVEFLDSQRKPVKDSDRAKMHGQYPYYGASGIIDHVNDYLFDEDLILLGEDGENIISRNLPLAFRISGKCWVNNHAHVLRPRNGFDVGFLVAYLEGIDYRQYNTGTAQPKLNKEVCAGIAVVRPPIEEQREIAVALSDADALIAALDKLIAKKRAIKLATTQQLLSGQIRLQGFGAPKVGRRLTAAGTIPEDWDCPILGELFTFKNGLNKAKEFFGYGTPIVNYMDVYGRRGLSVNDLDGRVSVDPRELKAFEVRRGDVFFTRTSETADEVGISSVMLDEPKDTVFSGFVLRARPKDDTLDDGFKKYCFSTSLVRQQIVAQTTETTRALTNGRYLSTVVIARPPKREQAAIATVLTDMDAEIAALECRREKTKAIKQGMMQALLTGRTRLV